MIIPAQQNKIFLISYKKPLKCFRENVNIIAHAYWNLEFLWF